MIMLIERDPSLLTTRALVLDRSDSTVLPPIYRLGQVDDIFVAGLVMIARELSSPLSLQSQVHLLELVVGQVRELVQPEPVVGHLLVGLIDVLQVLLEHLEPLQLLLQAVVPLLVLRHPRLEELDQLVDGFQVFLGIAHDRELAVHSRASKSERRQHGEE